MVDLATNSEALFEKVKAWMSVYTSLFDLFLFGAYVCVGVCVCVFRLTFVLTFDVKRSFRVCVCAKGIHLLLMAKRDQIAVPVSSRMAAVRVVNVCFFKGTP